MKIIYIDIVSSCNYYKDIINFLKKYINLKLLNPNSDFKKEINDFKPNIIIIGFGITNCSSRKPTLKLTTNIPIYIILNKEYSGLQQKLEWIKDMNPKKVFTVHHHYKKYQNKIKIPFTRIMWSADHNIFKKYDNNYKYDLFFSGVIRKEQTNNLRYKIYKNLIKLNKFNIYLTVKFLDEKPEKNVKKKTNFSNKDYAKNINWSKICLTTTGPADLVGTRYFEIMASNKAMILCNRMPKEVYDDIVIDGYNCIMFDDENDFVKKVKYYLEHEDKRQQIVKNAYQDFLEKHTWDHKVKYILQNI